jgi:hypothetical protein
MFNIAKMSKTPSSNGSYRKPLSDLTMMEANTDLMQGFARRSFLSSRRPYRKEQLKITAEFANKKALTEAQVAAALYEYEKIYKKLVKEQDKADLRFMMDRLAETQNPNLKDLEKNIRFWREKAGLPVGGRKSKRRRYKTTRKTRRRRNVKTRKNRRI